MSQPTSDELKEAFIAVMFKVGMFALVALNVTTWASVNFSAMEHALMLAIFHGACYATIPQSLPYSMAAGSMLSTMSVALGIEIKYSFVFWLALLCRLPNHASEHLVSETPPWGNEGFVIDLSLSVMYYVLRPIAFEGLIVSSVASRILWAPLICFSWVMTMVVASMAGVRYPGVVIWYHQLPKDVYTTALTLTRRLEEWYSSSRPDPSKGLPTFIYHEQLSKHEIRLIRLERRQFGRPPRCQLERYALSSVSTFTACSYVWGDTTTKRFLLVGGGKGETACLEISQSAYNVLDREQSFFTQKLIWIDAICINQHDQKEKANQVSIMTSIFARASRVRAYLDASLTTAGLSILVRLASQGVIRTQTKNEELRVGDCMSGILTEFFSSSWFRRAWVIQEAVVARDLQLIYRGTNMDWGIFDRILDLYISAQRAAGRPINDKMRKMMKYTAQIEPAALHISKLRRRWRIESSELPLVDLLSAGSIAQSSDPRDKIYAFLGIAEPGYDVPVSYSMSVTEVYTRTMRCIFEKTGTYGVLEHAGLASPDRIDSLPSWVATWSPRSPPLLKRQFDIERHQLASDRDIHAGQNGIYELKIGVYEALMIEALDNPIDFNDDWHIPGRDLSQVMQRLWTFAVTNVNRIIPRSQSLSTLRTIFWRTMVCGSIDPTYKSILGEEEAEIFRLVDKYFDVTIETDITADNFVGIEDSRAIRKGADYVDAAIACIKAEIQRTFYQKRLGITETGRLGVFPYEAQVGDVVAVLPHATNYSVLRKPDRNFDRAKVASGSGATRRSISNGDQCQLIGQCYVYREPAAGKLLLDDEWKTVTLI